VEELQTLAPEQLPQLTVPPQPLSARPQLKEPPAAIAQA
jgi:hypothetical protein